MSTGSAPADQAHRRWRGWSLLTPAMAALAAVAAGCAPADSRAGGGTGGAPVGCRIALQQVIPLPGEPLGAGAGAVARIRGTIVGNVSPFAVSWIWQAQFADGSGVEVTHPQADQALVDIPIARFGSYLVTAEVKDGSNSCGGAMSLMATKPGALRAFYTVRLQPPPGTFPAQEAPGIIEALAGSPNGNVSIQLDRGTEVTLVPRQAPGGTPLGAYIRVTESSSGLYQEGRAAADGAGARFKLPDRPHDVLVIPDGAVAPFLIQGRRPAQMAGQMLMLDQGTAVDGVVVDAAGAPIAGARVGLRAGALPSTLGESGADGSFTLRTRPGAYGATVVPAAALPGWELAVPATPGVVVPAGATRVTVRLGAIATARIGLSMTGAGAGSKLLMETRDAVPGAATVEVTQPGVTPAPPPVTLAASARIRLEATVGAGGAVSLPRLPRARYRATLFAARAAAPASITVRDIDATGGDVDAAMTIAPPVTISGMLGSAAADAQVLAIDEEARLALAPQAAGTFFTAVGAGGLFSLSVNPSRVYRVTVDPPPGGLFARMLLPPLTVAAAPVTLPTGRLPPGLLWGGRVIDPLLQPVPGVAVSAHCVAGNGGCVDPDSPVAEAVTAGDGSFRLVLPDPEPTP